MKKAIWVLLVLMLSAPFLGCRGKADDYSINNQNRIILRLAETQSPYYPSSRGAKEFARLVEEKSAGRIKVVVYDSGKLGDEISVVEQVQFGGIDLARVSAASLARYSSRLKAATLPYIITTPDQMWRIYDGRFGGMIKESLLKEKITCLAWYEGGVRGFYNSKKTINSVEDLKSLKISVQQSQTIIDLYSSLGISLVPTRPSDIYSALQTGAIDGAEDNIVAYYTSKHYEVAPYFTHDEHARIPEAIIGSRVTMLQLSKDDQAIIEQAAQESAVIQRKMWAEMERDTFKALSGAGVVISFGDYRGRDSLSAAARPFADSFGRDELAALAED